MLKPYRRQYRKTGDSWAIERYCESDSSYKERKKKK
jgi:hypothetical protein